MAAITEIGTGRVRNIKAHQVAAFPWAPVPTIKHNSEVVLKFTDPQPGGVKLGQGGKIVREPQSTTDLIQDIEDLCNDQSCVGIFFDNFDGDVIANWGKPGGAGAWEAYHRGLNQIYCISGPGLKSHCSRIHGDQLVFAGMLKTDDLQQQCLTLFPSQREVILNMKLCEIITEHSTRLSTILNATMRSPLTTMFVLSGGDQAIHACSKAVKYGDNKILLLRVGRHMNERDLALRADPRNNSKTYPHSGNGVTLAKSERLINYDFLLGCDFERNNFQCISNSNAYSMDCVTEIYGIEKMRIDPKATIDKVIENVCSLMRQNDKIELLVNIDCDTFNGIPSSSETFTGGLDPMWACYILDKLATLPRPPKIVLIAELQYHGDQLRKAIAEDFAAELLKAGVKAIQSFDKATTKTSKYY